MIAGTTGSTGWAITRRRQTASCVSGGMGQPTLNDTGHRAPHRRRPAIPDYRGRQCGSCASRSAPSLGGAIEKEMHDRAEHMLVPERTFGH